jgi:GrpB-like predicted nucleotidyltransferase (UPF0157 family)
VDEIVIEPYDTTWPARFADERRFVESCFQTRPLAIEHIGSTAVDGLAAKPVIDILVLVDDLDQGVAAVPALEADGYGYWRDNPDRTKLFLAKGLPPVAPQRTHHLHIHADVAERDRHVVFRNALRRDTALRDEYAALKRELALRFRHDREAYSDAKTIFVDRIVATAGGPARVHFRSSAKR